MVADAAEIVEADVDYMYLAESGVEEGCKVMQMEGQVAGVVGTLLVAAAVDTFEVAGAFARYFGV